MNDDVDDVAPVRATQRDKPAVTWYDPEGWPSWLRWCLALPIALLAAIVVYFIYNIANSFFPRHAGRGHTTACNPNRVIGLCGVR